MSVQLSPKSDPDGEECMSISNATWIRLTESVEGVTPWNQYHDSQEYTPEMLRSIAKAHPEHAKELEWLASCGGAILS